MWDRQRLKIAADIAQKQEETDKLLSKLGQFQKWPNLYTLPIDKLNHYDQKLDM